MIKNFCILKIKPKKVSSSSVSFFWWMNSVLGVELTFFDIEFFIISSINKLTISSYKISHLFFNKLKPIFCIHNIISTKNYLKLFIVYIINV